jgi:hypothetical protein
MYRKFEVNLVVQAQTEMTKIKKKILKINYFFIFLDCFDVLISKINFLKIKKKLS